MSDPIADMDELINQLPWHAAYTEHKDGVWHCCFNREQLVEVENKMRQQIGRELLEGKCYLAGTEYVDADYINEVCQLDREEK